MKNCFVSNWDGAERGVERAEARSARIPVIANMRLKREAHRNRDTVSELLKNIWEVVSEA